MNLRIFLPALFILFISITTVFSFLTIRAYVTNEVETEQYHEAKYRLNTLQGHIERLLLLNDVEGVRKVISSYASEPDVKAM